MSKTSRFSPSRLRTARGRLSLEAVAAAVSRSSQTIRNWEAGTHEPSASDVAALAVFLGKPMLYFFGGDEPEVVGMRRLR